METNKSTLLLFGAGASIPFFNPPITTSSITKHIADKGNWDRVIAICKKYNPRFSLTADYVHSLIQVIANNNFEPNFESICNSIDNIAFVKMTREWNNPIKNELLDLNKCGILKLDRENINKIEILPFFVSMPYC